MTAPTPSHLLTRAAPLAATSWDPTARTLEVVFSTGATVERADARGPYNERLSLDQDWAPFIGAPVLNAHRRGDVSDVLGHVISARTIGGEARATIKLSRRPDVEVVVQDILDGHLRGVSVGYAVEAWRDDSDPATGLRTRTATRWMPVELSIVPIPADRGSIIRSEPLPDVLPNTEPQPTNPPPAPIITPPAPAIAERAAVNIQIRAIAQVAGLDQAWTDGQIDAGATVEAARTAASTVETRMAANPTLRTTRAEIIADHNDPEIRIRAAGEAVYARFTPGHQISERARQYAGLTTLDLARESLRLRSYATTGLAPAAIIERALHTTSDFPLLLGEAINRTLREAYRAAPSGLKRVGRQTTAKDFRDKHRLALSEAPRLEKVNEAGEFKSGTLAETEESYRLATYGRIIGISRQAIINDDLSAFADLARRMGQAAAATEAQLLVDLLVSNAGNGPQMSDGKPLFDAAHKNKIGSGGSAPGVASLTTGRTALRRQVGLTGELIEMEPKFILIPPELETSTEQVLTTLHPTKADDVNPFSSKLSLVVEPRFTDAKRWYLTADPGVSDGLEYAYLEGQEGVQLETQYGFEVDGIRVRARLDFGAGFVDWRSWHQNPGA
ncbi:prohead protease/major capsid protein fusion protein [Methylobacterium aquaticum]|uniref:Uncharacterized protein n=1 Tax=Methylobacterium aquaticum TaxID=270351 RepID=A0A0C6FBR0_9HYPH|nr:prohead protease/major capsid protein fusion protein [Methylobacterium aquaticum]BAQ44252.1 hypothetical protein Maq22A_c04135 [Methylobacterium aquaticum]